MAGHGICVRDPQGEEGSFVQQYLPHSGMGPSLGNTRVYGVCTPHQGTCPTAKANWDMPHNSNHIAGEENSMTDIPSWSFGSKLKWHCRSNTNLLTLFNNLFPFSISELLDRLPNFLRDQYASDFRTADDGFHTGPVVATTKGWETFWTQWSAYVAPMGVDPFVQDTPFTIRVRLLTGFEGCIRTGYYGQGRQIQAGSVSNATTAIGQAIPLAMNTNPTIIVGSDKLLPCLQQMFDGFRKVDPPTTKQLPVEADVPEFLIQL